MKGLLFTYALTYGGAVIALINPFIGLLIYVCFAILKPDALWPWSVPEGNYSRIIGIALLCGWAGKGFGNWQLGNARAIVAALVGFWLWSALGALQAPDQAVAWAFVESMAKIVLPFLVGITTIDSIRKLKQLTWVIVLCHGYLAFEFNLAYLNGINVVRDIGFGGLLGGSIAITMVTCIGPAYFLGMDADRWWLKGLALGCGAMMMHVVLFSFSRGGMIALAVTAITCFALIPKQTRHYLAFAIALLLTIRLTGSEVWARFMTTFASTEVRDGSAQSRLDLWRDCWDVLSTRPLFGVGPNHWHLVAHEYGWPAGKEAHSTWLQTAAELGIPGVLALLIFYVLCATRIWGLARRGAVPDPWFRQSARMVVAAVVGFAVSSQFVSLVGLEVPYYVLLLGAGTLKLYSLDSTETNRRDEPEMIPEPAVRSRVDAWVGADAK